MRDEHARFDVSDVDSTAPETLERVLEVARSVVLDYGDDATTTRIAQLARWVTKNLGGLGEFEVSVQVERPVAKYAFTEPDELGIVPALHPLVRVGTVFAALPKEGPAYGLAVGSVNARRLAVALLRAAQDADAEDAKG